MPVFACYSRHVRTLRVLVSTALTLGLFAGCSSTTAPKTHGPTDAPDGAAPSQDAAMPTTDGSSQGPDSAKAPGPDAAAGPDTGSSPDGAPASDGGAPLPAGTAIVRVHYPAGAHAVTVRGSAGGLNWTTGKSTTAAGDTFTSTLTGLTATVEYKPLLDDTTWALGPNYHVSSGETVDVWPHFTTMKGQVQTLIAAFHSTVLNDDRAIYAYLPASYAENTDATYPVVYMHDGQNLWAALPQLAFSGTWNVDTTFDTASQVGACSAGGVVGWGAQPLGGTAVTCNGDTDCPSADCRTFPEAIVIGIANDANRVFEYTPTVDPTETSLGPAGGADQYLQMIVTELKPTIDGMLRTRPDVASTALAGSSLGGLVTAYAGLKHPDVFGLVAELSPSTWWDTDVIVTDVQATPAARPLIVYVDSGQGTVDDEADTDMLAAAYVALGYMDGKNFRHVIQPGAAHNETYWAERFPGAIQLLLGTR